MVWEKDGDVLQSSVQGLGETQDQFITLLQVDVDSSTFGTYSVTVQNDFGNFTATINIINEGSSLSCFL